MFEIKKTFEISASHKLNLPYDSPCQRWHGHNYFVTICCRGERDANGMVVDFSEVKKKIKDVLDHRCLNDIKGIGFDILNAEDLEDRELIHLNPTAENIAFWICKQIDKCYRVDVQESEGNVATYFDDTPQFDSSLAGAPPLNSRPFQG
jgi:6-pyruvoyltetrahydropterin/6-carboxytetrahydropterin synthase